MKLASILKSLTHSLRSADDASIAVILFLLLLLFTPVDASSQSKKSDKYFANGVEEYEKGDYAKAIEWFSKADDLDRKEIPENSTRCEYCQTWIASCHYKSGNIEKAKETSRYEYFLPPVDRRLTVESDKEGDLAYEAYLNGNYEDALSHAMKSLELEQHAIGELSYHAAGAYTFISKIYVDMEQPTEALKYCDKGIGVMDSMGIKYDVNLFQILQYRIHANLQRNLTAMTFSDIDRIEKIAENEISEFGNIFPSVLVKLLKSKISIQSRNDEKEAENLISEAFYQLVDAYDPDHNDYFSALMGCIDNLETLGKLDRIIGLIKSGITDLQAKGLSCYHKGLLLSQEGLYITDNAEALAILQESSSLLKDCDDSDAYYLNQCRVADIYKGIKDNSKAIETYQSVIDEYSGGNMTEGTYRYSLTGLGDIYMELGKTKEAYKCYKTAISLLEKDKSNPANYFTWYKWIPICLTLWDESDPEDLDFNLESLGTEFNNMMSNMDITKFLYQGYGVYNFGPIFLDFIQALLNNIPLDADFSFEPMEQFLRTLTFDYIVPTCSLKQPLTLEAIKLLATLHYRLGNYDEAVSFATKALEIARIQDWETRNILHDLAYYQYDSGNTADAYENFAIGYDFIKEDFLNNFRWMTLEERTYFANANRGNLDNLPRYAALTPEDRRYAGLGYDALLFTKGLLLNSSIELSRLLQEEGDKESLKLLNEWRNLSLKIRNSSNLPESDVSSLKEKAAGLEKELLSRSRTFGEYTNGLTVRFQDVQTGLASDDIAIEFFSYWKKPGVKAYGALLLTKTDAPLFLEIAPEEDFLSADLSSDCYRSSALFDLVFGRIKQFMPSKDKGCVYFAVDGILHSVALENLPGSESYSLRRLSSTRELALASGKKSDARSISLFGGIKYGLGELSSYYEIKDEPADDTIKTTRESDEFLVYLPGTKKETDGIRSILTDRINISSFTDEKATKSRFRALSGNHTDIVHIATHGYFKADGDSDPMEQSGLYFAGAQNTLWDMDADKLKDDGILSAHEISILDLRGLKLAVLSACETGRGIISADGVFGLQRGFKQAGTESILMSLWKVDDKATAIFMTEFYRQLISGVDQYDAVKNARSAVMAVYPDPRYWAAFILIDGHRPLTIRKASRQ